MRKQSGLISLFDRIILYSLVALERHKVRALGSLIVRVGRLADAVRLGISTRSTSGNDRPVLRISSAVHRPMFTLTYNFLRHVRWVKKFAIGHNIWLPGLVLLLYSSDATSETSTQKKALS